MAMIGAFLALNCGFAALIEWSDVASHPIDVQTRAVLDARLSSFFGKTDSAAPRAVFLGDSVVFGSKLQNTHGDRWKWLTLPAQHAALTGDETLNLGINGVLFSDLDCVAREALAHGPELLVVNVSPRPFAADFADADNTSARSFLCEAMDVTERVGRWIPLLAYRDVWQFRWLESSPKQFLVDALAARIQPTDPFEEDEEGEDSIDLDEIIWKTKASNRLNSVELSDDHPQSAHLDKLLGTLASHRSTDVVVLYLEEDTRALSDQLDIERYRVQQQRFVARLSRIAARTANITFVHAKNSDFEGLYDDHVHLTADGYTRLARILRDVPQSRNLGDAID